MQSKNIPKPEEYYDYDRLERASLKLHLNPAVPENEIRLMNLHNHLIWRSYRPLQDEVMDAIFCIAIREVVEDYSLKAEDIPGWRRMLLEETERRNETWTLQH